MTVLPGAADERLRAGCARMHLQLEGAQHDQLLALIALLHRWSRAFNLTAVRDPEQMVGYHLLDSLAVRPFLRGERILDVGTGAGFPGLPLAIVEPDRRFVLLDGNGKKVRFVRQAVLELEIHNVDVIQTRIETYECREKFATITARAFAPLSRIVDLTKPCLDSAGVLLALKSRETRAELETLPDSATRTLVHRLDVPYVNGERTVIEIEL